MKGKENIVTKLLSQYRLIRSFEIILFALTAGLIGYTVLNRSGHYYLSIAVGTTLLVGIGFYLIQQYKFFSLDSRRIARYLNQQYPSLQNSIDLLLASDNSLTPLEEIQKQKIEIQLSSVLSEIKLPNKLIHACSSFAFALLVFFVFPSAPISSLEQISKPIIITESLTSQSNKYELSITVKSPHYTNIQELVTAGPAIKSIEGSTITWQLKFSQEVQNARLILSGLDTLSYQKKGKVISFNRVADKSGFYLLQWQWNDSTYTTDYASIEVTPDNVPNIRVEGLKQFTELKLIDNQNINLQAVLKDDFGLSSAQIIATVSKGSGESVKFREEKLSFSQPVNITGKNVVAKKIINLTQLGLESGDELYFYIEALDNKFPVANRSRTETFFIALQDTSEMVTVDDEGLGVDLMPEYFRSQRQIIIDSEKLLAERKKTSKETFNSTSNELGYDQKVLRLRYGQFMGEEFETAIGPTETETEEEHEVNSIEDVTKTFGHQHDTENEHNLVDQSKTNEKNKNPLEEFAHNHDNTEEATFFIQSVKAKLRAALTLMWDAELHLRMFDPEKSLPYQYKILRLLKEISNDSRIYVHRTGFDPPPLKEDKRLTGDLNEVRTSSTKRSLTKPDAYTDTKKAIAVLAAKENRYRFNENEQLIIGAASKDVAKAAVENPGQYLETLSLLKMISEGKPLNLSQQNKLYNQLVSLLPDQVGTPSLNLSNKHSWDELLINNLEKSISDE